MEIIKIGEISFGANGLVFSGWEVKGGSTREFQIAAINMVAPNYFVRQTMLYYI